MYEVPYGEDGGSGDLDKMRLALAKQNKPMAPPPTSAQIPGYGRPVPPAQTKPDPLSAAANNFTTLATQFNPLMMMKSMQESVRALNPAIPVAGAWADVAQNIQTAGAEAMYDILGDPQGIMRMQKNYVPVTTGRFYQEPTTQLGKEFETGVTKAMDASKMPAVWPLAMNQPVRPPITPNDVRVIGAEATRVGRQIKDIPTDFVNAQSGLQKLDPITGQPTYGAKLQGVAESVGDIMAQREMQGLPPVPGLPASMQPTSPKLYAMRPEGSRVTSATLPATAKADAATYAPAQEIVSNVIDSTTITPVQALDEIQNNILRKPEAASARRAFESFLKTKANEMYPDAPSEGAALAAYKARFGDREASAAHSLEMYDAFLNTPNGIQYRAALNLPSAEELPARHEAASNWLNSQFTNYIIEKVGTPNEPAAKLASQGLTFYPPSEIFDNADMSGAKIRAKRTEAGMPAKTQTDEALAAADQQLVDLMQRSGDAATRKREQETIAKQLGYGVVDPNTGVVPEGMNLGRYEPFAQASRESDKANAAYIKQQKVVDNLRLGSAYESATDKAISAPTAKKLKEEIEYSERQFYPALMRTPDTERAYIANPVQLRNLGFEDLAKSFYNDVMSGKIPLNKVPKMTVEKYIRDTAEGRIAAEKLAQAKEKQFKMDADTQFKLSADTHIPNDKIFGNVGALEITNRFTPDEVAKLVSEDTLALDVCIGEGGNVRGKPNPWHPGTGDRQYIPIYDIVTGQRNPDATSPRGSYINAVAQGSQMVSFRDTVTGEPVAIFDFNPSASGKYDINFASGRRNKEVKPAYVEGIKSYLNSREDSIRGVSHNLNDNLDIYDSKRMSNSALADIINMPVSEFKKYDVSNLPRFITRTDLRNYIEELKANEPVAQVPAIMSQRPSESLDAYVAGAVSSSIDNVLESVRRDLEEGGEDHQTSTAVAFFEDTRDYFNTQQAAQGPIRALELTHQRLYDLESEYANSPRIVANIIAEGIADLMDDLNGYTDYARNRQAAEAAQPRTRAIAAQGDPMPDLDTPELLTAYRDRLTPEQVDWLQDFAERFEDERSPVAVDNLIEEFARWRSDNRLLPAAPVGQNGRPQYLRMTHDAFMQLENDFGTEAANEMRSAVRSIIEQQGVDPQISTDAFITALRIAAHESPLGTVDIAMRNLADQIESVYMRDWEPEEAPAAPAQPFDFARLVDGIVDEVSRNANPGVGNRVDTIAYRIAERVNPRLNPEGYARALRQVRTDTDHVAVGPALRALADRIHLERFAEEPAQAQQPVNYRPATQDQASAALMQINHEIGTQARFLADEHNAATTQLFAANLGRLYSENNLNAIGDTPGSLNRFGNYLQGFRNDLAAQIPDLNRSGFQGVAAASAIQNVINAVDTQLANFRVRGADLDNQRNDAIFQLENAVNDPELNPDDLRMMANGLSNPVDQTANSPWISLTDTERREYALALRERANYIEFSPADFAIRLSNEAGMNIPDLRDTVQALNDGAFDHEVLRGLPAIERDRAAQRTALNLNHILQGMQDDALRRGNADEGRNVVPAEITDADRELYDEFNAIIRNAIRDEDFEPNNHTSDELAEWILNDEIGGLDDLTTEQRRRLSALVREYGYGGILPLGFANGGPVQGYQKGGSVKKPEVKTPWLFSVPTYSETVAFEMYPGQRGQDDQRDAARHMLAAGTLSRKYGAGPAEFIGKAHEYVTSPLQAVKSMFTGKMPADFDMDTHNNRIGAQLGQRAKSQAELEDLVQEEAERASRTQTSDKAFIKKANGGIVQQNPTTDQMRYALMMRRK